jgi:hypothetical protein
LDHDRRSETAGGAGLVEHGAQPRTGWHAHDRVSRHLREGGGFATGQLVARSNDGPVLQLAARFNIHRTTVLAHLERNG